MNRIKFGAIALLFAVACSASHAAMGEKLYAGDRPLMVSRAASCLGISAQGLTSGRLAEASTEGTVSETLHVATPGSLKELLVDLETQPEKLALTGALNSKDLEYIHAGTGKMAAVQELDLSAITLSCDGGAYATLSLGNSDIGMGGYSATFYLSDECRVDTTSSSTGLGGGNVVYHYYGRDLAGTFSNNTRLKRVVLPASLSEIGDYVFAGSSISSVVLSSGITRIPRGAFSGTTSLESLSLSNQVVAIGEGAFAGSSIQTLAAAGLRTIGANAFMNSSIANINLSGVTGMGASAFIYTTALSSVDLSSLETIPEKCFEGSSVSSVKLGKGLKHIGASAFASYSGGRLKSITLPEGLLTIGPLAFRGEIESMNIPSTVEYIGTGALSNNWLYNQPTQQGVWYFGKVAYAYDNRVAGVSALNIKEGTVSISGGFVVESLRQTLRTLSLPSSLKTIGVVTGEADNTLRYDGAFYDCASLESVNLPDGLEIIGDGTFSGCTKLNVPSLPASLREIGEEAFRNCSSLYSISLPEGLEVLGSQAFQGCTGLSSVKMYSTCLKTLGDPWFRYAEKVTVGEKVTVVPNDMFYRCQNLIKVQFDNPESSFPALEIGEYAFNDCKALTIPQLPLRTVKVGKEAFGYVGFGESFSTANLVSIGERAFISAKGIKHLRVENTLEECGGGAFSEIDGLRTIYYNAPNLRPIADAYYNSPFNRSSLDTITIGKDVTYIPENFFRYQSSVSSLTFEPRTSSVSLQIDERAFQNCKGIRSLVLPDTRTAIGSNAFDFCTALQSVRLGNGTENIDVKAFNACNLKFIDVPTSVVSIGEDALYRSYGATIYFHTAEPPAMNARICSTDAVIYVPAPAVDTYKALSSLSQNKVLPYALTGLSLDKTSLTLGTGATDTLCATIAPEQFAGLNVRYTSSNEDVVSVDHAGVLVGKKAGTAVVTASLAYLEGYTAACEVKVTGSSGIDGVEADGKLSLVVRLGELQVVGAHPGDTIIIYTMDGRQIVRSSRNATFSLPRGLYIVRVEGIAAKGLQRKVFVP